MYSASRMASSNFNFFREGVYAGLLSLHPFRSTERDEKQNENGGWGVERRDDDVTEGRAGAQELCRAARSVSVLMAVVWSSSTAALKTSLFAVGGVVRSCL